MAKLDRETYAQAIEALTRWYPYLEVCFTWSNATVILGALQVALTHPKFPAEALEVVKGFVDSALDTIRRVSPEMADHLGGIR